MRKQLLAQEPRALLRLLCGGKAAIGGGIEVAQVSETGMIIGSLRAMPNGGDPALFRAGLCDHYANAGSERDLSPVILGGMVVAET
ncbi:MAG: hypothetical protein PVF70_01060 [Anaerolineales bacterium]|jgi:hypothetical protein